MPKDLSEVLANIEAAKNPIIIEENKIFSGGEVVNKEEEIKKELGIQTAEEFLKSYQNSVLNIEQFQGLISSLHGRGQKLYKKISNPSDIENTEVRKSLEEISDIFLEAINLEKVLSMSLKDIGYEIEMEQPITRQKALYGDYGIIQFYLKNYDEAIKALTQELTIIGEGPRINNSLFYRGKAYLARNEDGDLKNYFNDFRKIIEISLTSEVDPKLISWVKNSLMQAVPDAIKSYAENIFEKNSEGIYKPKNIEDYRKFILFVEEIIENATLDEEQKPLDEEQKRIVTKQDATEMMLAKIGNIVWQRSEELTKFLVKKIASDFLIKNQEALIRIGDEKVITIFEKIFDLKESNSNSFSDFLDRELVYIIAKDNGDVLEIPLEESSLKEDLKIIFNDLIKIKGEISKKSDFAFSYENHIQKLSEEFYNGYERILENFLPYPKESTNPLGAEVLEKKSKEPTIS
ncbi:MAG: hypothetical protein SFV53_02425 [Rickettsiales bacterium]|nr:hypothetical protein [Rickettsiales bacterium]